jgi:peptide/nickel transport system permease protein
LLRWFDSDVGHSFRTSPVAMAAALVAFVCLFCAPSPPGWRRTTPSTSRRWNWATHGCRRRGCRRAAAKYLLGTDDQGRDILSALMYGARISLIVGIVAVVLSLAIGVALGLLAGFLGGWIDTFLMRLCDVMLSFPAHPGGAADRRRRPRLFPNAAADGGLRRADPRHHADRLGAVRPHRARLHDGGAQQGIRAGGAGHRRAVAAHHGAHVLPNVLGPVLVLATIHLATAIITEATLSFLGVGVPPTQPSLGTLIQDRQRLPLLGRMVDHHVPRRHADR